MTINSYVKKWCDEDYDVRKENFYMDNAYYVAEREWAVAGLIHGLITLGISAFLAFFLPAANAHSFILELCTNLGIFTVCFWLYSIRNFGANSLDSALGIYILAALLLFITKGRIGDIEKFFFAFPAMALWTYLTFARFVSFVKMATKMKARIREEEQEEEKGAKDSYERWEQGYKAFRYGLPEKPIDTEDPLLIEARKLFEGYEQSKQMLKTRYRELAKKYHPDHGGSTEKFQCIISAYEELNKRFV